MPHIASYATSYRLKTGTGNNFFRKLYSFLYKLLLNVDGSYKKVIWTMLIDISVVQMNYCGSKFQLSGINEIILS